MSSGFSIFTVQGNWNFVGRIRSDPRDFPDPRGQFFVLRDASIINVWGTNAGLGQLTDGPRAGTELTPLQGDLHINPTYVIWSYETKVWTPKEQKPLVRGTFSPRAFLVLSGSEDKSEVVLGQPTSDPRTNPELRQFVLDDAAVLTNWQKFGISDLLAGPSVALQQHTYPRLNIPRSRVIWTVDVTSWPSPNPSR